MELSELVSYAGETYQIREERKWTDFPGFSVLCHPQTGKWVALLMRQWDGETGTEIERCDLKCGKSILSLNPQPFLSAPFRMRGSRWVGVAFGRFTEREVVTRLFDQAVRENTPHGFTLVLDSHLPSTDFSENRPYQETSLPFAGSAAQPQQFIPERLREMRRLYQYGRETEEARAENFYRQAMFMQDYEDNVPWSGDFVRYFPTYHDLSLQQLRGYFTWRAGVRRGQFRPIAASAAYIYVYELLNGVGADGPWDVLQKLQAFETGFLDSGIGDPRMRANLRRWMLEYAVLSGLPRETARQYADPEQIERDEALALLEEPDEADDGALFEALSLLGGKKLSESPVLTLSPGRGRHLFGEVWRSASKRHDQGEDLFTHCFGELTSRRWYPLSNAVYYWRTRQKNRDYALSGTRSYLCLNGLWYVKAFEPLSFDRDLFRGFLHQTDARLRRYLKTGRYLKEKPADAWANVCIDAVIDADRRAELEAARPKINLDLSGLDRIRRDAAGTRDSLLTADELQETEALPETGEERRPVTAELPEVQTSQGSSSARTSSDEVQTESGQPATGLQASAEVPASPTAPFVPEISTVSEVPGDPGSADAPVLPLDAVQIQVVSALLRGEDPTAILKASRLMPSIAADRINDALFDEIGDTVLLCEDDRLMLVEDYMEDLTQLLGGHSNG